MNIKTLLFISFSLVLNGILHSQTWQIVPNSPETNVRFEDLWFINADTGWVVEYAGADRILKTTDGGLNFTVQFTSPDSIRFRSCAFNNDMLGWAGSINGELYKTTNGGDNWLRVDTMIHPSPYGFCDMSIVGDSLFYSTGRYDGPANFIKSTDAGTTFQFYDMSNYAAWLVGCYFKNKDTGFAACRSNISSEGAVILYTTNGGSNWTKVYTSGLQSEHIWYVLPFHSSPDMLYASVQSFAPIRMHYLISADGGQTWTRHDIINSSGQYAEAIGFVNNLNTGWVACGNGYGMFRTTNGGMNWSYLNLGQSIHSLFVVNDTIAYASGKQIYKYTNGIIGIRNEQTPVPSQFHILYNNYPNPFNSTTVFHYYLKRRTYVRFGLYDAEGRFVHSFITGFQDAGDYKFKWNSDNFASGVYFYVLQTDEGILSGKALLLK